jgi:hypothetical protein
MSVNQKRRRVELNEVNIRGTSGHSRNRKYNFLRTGGCTEPLKEINANRPLYELVTRIFSHKIVQFVM